MKKALFCFMLLLLGLVFSADAQNEKKKDRRNKQKQDTTIVSSSKEIATTASGRKMIFLPKGSKLKIIDSTSRALIMTVKTSKGEEFDISKSSFADLLIQLAKADMVISLFNKWAGSYKQSGKE